MKKSKTNNPFITTKKQKKKGLFNFYKKPEEVKPAIDNKNLPEEKSIFIRPGNPYNIISKLIHTTPIIPILYKLDRMNIDNDCDNNASYEEMYEYYMTYKKHIDSKYSKFINITTCIKVEIDTSRYEDTKIIRDDINEFISDWSFAGNRIKIYSHMIGNNIEGIFIILYGSLEGHKYYFKNYYNKDNKITIELITAIATSNKIYKDIIFDNDTIDESQSTLYINTMFTNPQIQAKIDAGQYEDSDEKKYNDKFYNLTKMNSNINILYIDDYTDLIGGIEDFFKYPVNQYFDEVIHGFDLCNIICWFKIESKDTLFDISLYKVLKKHFNPNDDNQVGNTISEFILEYMQKNMDFKLDTYDKYDLSKQFSNTMDSYDNVDELIEEEEIL